MGVWSIWSCNTHRETLSQYSQWMPKIKSNHKWLMSLMTFVMINKSLITYRNCWLVGSLEKDLLVGVYCHTSGLKSCYYLLTLMNSCRYLRCLICAIHQLNNPDWRQQSVIPMQLCISPQLSLLQCFQRSEYYVSIQEINHETFYRYTAA